MRETEASVAPEVLSGFSRESRAAGSFCDPQFAPRPLSDDSPAPNPGTESRRIVTEALMPWRRYQLPQLLFRLADDAAGRMQVAES